MAAAADKLVTKHGGDGEIKPPSCLTAVINIVHKHLYVYFITNHLPFLLTHKGRQTQETQIPKIINTVVLFLYSI